MMFFNRSEAVPIRSQSVPQTIETPVSFTPAPGAYIRYAYSRSSDSMSSGIEGQDYLAFQHNDQRLVMVVADGVGSSFCGNLAARILGDEFLKWMWSLDITYLGGASALMESAMSYLNRLQKQAQIEVNEYEIPDEVTGLVRQALEAQRDYGSEAIFAAARIDHPSPMIPEGLVSVCWMGDTRIHVLHDNGTAVDLGGSWENANRWSTKLGAKGRMSAWMSDLRDIARVVSYTDGLSAHDEGILDYGDSYLDRMIHQGARLPTSDDVAFVDVVLRTATYEGYPDPELPDPSAERPRLEQVWNPTGGDTYEIRWNWDGSDKDRFMVQEADSPSMADGRLHEVPAGQTTWRPASAQKPGHYYYRVRGVKRNGSTTPWSELRQTRVAYPPPPAPTLELSDPDSASELRWSEEGEALDYTLERALDDSFEDPETVYAGRGTSWAVPMHALTPATYYFRARATSSGGAGPWSDVQEITITLPPPPTPHLAIAGGYGMELGSYQFRWQPVPGATFYELREVDADGEETVHTFEETIFDLEDQPMGEYTYHVRACHDYGCSEWSNEQRVNVVPPRPQDAPDLTIEDLDGASEITLRWTEVEGATEYYVEVSEVDTFVNARVHTTDEPFLTLARREPGVVYVRVAGANAGGEGPFSSVEELVVSLDAPAWIEAKLPKGSDQIGIGWASVGGRATYVLDMATNPEDPTSYREIYRGEDTHYEIPISQAGEALRFRVRADVPGLQSSWQISSALRFTPDLPAPRLAAPIIDERSVVRLKWDTVAKATHYILEVARNQDFDDAHSTASVDKTEVNFTAPTSGTFWFRVKACDRTHVGAPSRAINVNIKRPAPPRLWPVDTVKAGQPFEVTWKGMPGTLYYEIQLSKATNFPEADVSESRVYHPAQKWGVDGRPAGQYHFRVRAVDNDSQHSLWSDPLPVDVK